MRYEGDKPRAGVRRPADPVTAGPGRGSTALGSYQPGLDGIRGAGMLIILGYHGGLAWTDGAFLALSQFFTLSGFLITGVLLRNHLRPGGRSLGAFWARRIRRLLPAAVVGLAVVVVFGATVASQQQAEELPGQVAAAATWSANWHFIATGSSYIDLFDAPSPVQHFWSLAIEEQFYLLLPLGMLLFLRKTRSPRALFVLFSVSALISTAWMVALYEWGASLDRLYYGTDTRMAELLTGAALAVVIARTGLDFSERARRALLVVGLVAFALTLWCWTSIPLADGAIWRGGFLVYSLLSCGVILGVLGGRGPVVALLSLPPLVYVGRISYGVYLYHWPVFLWLTEDRTSLGRWPLFALRLAVTFLMAGLSFRLLERPIMRGASLGIPPRPRLVAIPTALALVVAAGYVAVDRSREDPLITLRAASAEMPRVASDGVLDVLVIPGRSDDPVLAAIQQRIAGDASISLAVAEPFVCSGGLVDTSGGPTCASWAGTWPRLIERHDPDVVVLLVDDWAGDPLEDLTGRPPAEQAAPTAAILAPALDLLTAEGASVVRATFAQDLADGIRRSFLPFNQAMARLEHERTDLFKVIQTAVDPTAIAPEEFAENAAAAVLTDASLYQRRDAGDVLRVMIVGDSQAISLGYGLERWAAETDRALVWNRGVEACGLALDGESRRFGNSDSGLDRCRDSAARWPDQVGSFRPDIVIVLSSLADLQDRKLPGASQFSSFGQSDFDDFLVAQYEGVVDVLSAEGAQVVWMTAPCTELDTTAGPEAGYDGTGVEHLNSEIIPRLVDARPDRVVTFDLFAVMCPDGEPVRSIDGVDDLRPDGVHFSVDGALWFAETYGEQVLTLGS